MARPKTFSPSALAEFRESPRAFWIKHRHGVERPRGIFSAMPNAIDAIIKARYDEHRGKTVRVAKVDPLTREEIEVTHLASMPSEFARLQERGAFLYPDKAKLRKMRAWQSAPVYVDPVTEARLSGALDEAMVIPDEDGKLMVCSTDVKTTKSRDNLGEYSATYYLLGQSAYHLMLDTEFAAGGFGDQSPAIEGVGDQAVLAYYMPEPSESADQVMRWRSEVVLMTVDRSLPIEVLRAAVECLAGQMPEPGRNEDWDDYIAKYQVIVGIEEKNIAEAKREALEARKAAAA